MFLQGVEPKFFLNKKIFLSGIADVHSFQVTWFSFIHTVPGFFFAAHPNLLFQLEQPVYYCIFEFPIDI